MSATFLPSNLIVPNEKSLNNPNWTQTETGTPVSSVLTEDIQDRLMVVVCRHPSAFVESHNSIQDGGLVDGASKEVSGIFVAKDLSLQGCTAIQLEEVTLTGPLSGKPGGQARNLTQTLCGDYIDDAFVEPRRFSPMATDMSIPLIVAGVVYSFNMTNFLPYGQSIAWYNLSDVVTWLLNAWTSFMQNNLGDASFYATVYVDNVTPRIFWSSTTYGPGQIRFMLSDVRYAGVPSFLSALKSHLFFLDTRTGDTSQASNGYATGESMGILARKQTGIQNNATCLTFHSTELTQYRKSDTLAPADGASLIGVLSAPLIGGSDADNGMGILFGNIKGGSLTSPKIAFDKTQTLTEFMVYLRAVDAGGSTVIQFSQTEVRQITALLIFRCW